MRVLVLGADDRSANLGVRVLAEGAGAVARHLFGEDAEVVFQDLGPNADGFRISADLIKQDFGRAKGPIKRWLRGFDLVLDTGAGDSFTDIYGRNRFGRIVYTQLVARRLGIPVVVLPQTVGPFNSWLTRLLAARALRRATVVMTRDRASADAASTMSRRSVVRATDLVFLLPEVRPESSRDIVLNVSGLLWSDNPHVDCLRYQESVYELIQTLRENGREVTFMPHVLENATHDNDIVPLRELSARFPEFEVAEPQSLSEVRQIVSTAKWVIGSRMHACLNAISVGTPAVPWAYSRKFAPLLEDIGWDLTVDLRTEGDPVVLTMSHISDTGRANETLRSALGSASSRNAVAINVLTERLANVVG